MSFPTPRVVVRCLLRLALPVILLARCASGEERPFGLAERIPWTRSQLVGSPEPPLPFTARRTFEKLELKSPIYLAEEPATGRLLAVLEGTGGERPARIVAFANTPDVTAAEPYFELPGRLIYSICFHPRYEQNAQVFIFSNGPTGQSERVNRVTRYSVDRKGAPRIDPASEQLILEWRSAGHDGGDMAFGNDGTLYISTGDGTSDSDGWNSGQTLDDLLGAVLRIDVDHRDGDQPYVSPRDNPFVGVAGARPELWAYGLRNPWRMSYDAKTAQLWVGNNGQDLWETAQLVRRGENYGWSVYEGNHPFYLGRQLGPNPHTPPTIEHHHAEFRSLTGGVVYHDGRFPELDGVYIYGDYSTGRIWGMKHDGLRAEWHRELADTSLQIAAFCLTRDGELLIVDHAGGVDRLEVAPPARQETPFPLRLGDTGLFLDTAKHVVDPALVPYSLNAPAWNDGAGVERFVALPGGTQVEYDAGRSWNFPDGAALVQTLSMGDQRLETRVLLKQQGEWAAYAYIWNDEQTDAELAPKEGGEMVATVRGEDGNTFARTWRVPSRAECLACHSRAANFVLGISTAQLEREHAYGTVSDNQLRAWDHARLFKDPPPARDGDTARLVNPYDAGQPLEPRVRAYLHVNCSACHIEAGGGNAKLELGLHTARERMNLIAARPQHDTFGIDNAMLVHPGDPERSVLWQRLRRRGPGQMPPIFSRAVDEEAVGLIRAWIAQLPPDRPIVKQWTMDDFAEGWEQEISGRVATAGEQHFRTTGCIQCHRIGDEGGVVGPNLREIGSRLKPQELLESVLLPSKLIAEGYAGVTIETADGRLLTGRIEHEDDQRIILRPASASEPSVLLAPADVIARERLTTSNMPTGTVNVLARDEILDLIAYLAVLRSDSSGPDTETAGR